MGKIAPNAALGCGGNYIRRTKDEDRKDGRRHGGDALALGEPRRDDGRRARGGGFCAGEVTDLVLDLQKLEYVSSAGLRQFALAQKRMAAKGGSFSLVRVPEFVKEVLAMTGLVNHLEVLG